MAGCHDAAHMTPPPANTIAHAVPGVPVAKTLVGLVLCLGLGSLPFPAWDNEFVDVGHLVGNEAIYWALAVQVLVYVRVVEDRSLASIGLRRPAWRDLLAAIGFALAILAGMAALFVVVLPALRIALPAALEPLTAAPSWWLSVSVVRAGVSEEILFRGYPIERLQAWTGSRVVAAVVPLTAFALAHVGPWGWGHLVVAAFGDAMLTWLYLWRRNLWASILAHCLIDGAAVVS
jgi:uncharacterized protein